MSKATSFLRKVCETPVLGNVESKAKVQGYFTAIIARHYEFCQQINQLARRTPKLSV